MAIRAICWICVVAVIYQLTEVVETDQLPAQRQKTYKKIKESFSHCRICINELVLGTSNNENHFVELAKVCTSLSKQESNSNLKQFRLLFISGSAKLLAMCQLDGLLKDAGRVNTSKRRYFYVIGNNGIPGAQLKFSQCQKDPSLDEKLPLGDILPIAVVLLNKDFSDDSHMGLQLIPDKDSPTGFRKKQMLGGHIEMIVNHLEDFVVFGSKTVYSDCDIFRLINKEFTPKPVHILWEQALEAETKVSIIRCGEATEPLVPEAMKYGDPSPGSDNNCAEAIDFPLENVRNQLAQPKKESVDAGEYCYVTHAKVANNIEIPVLVNAHRIENTDVVEPPKNPSHTNTNQANDNAEEGNVVENSNVDNQIGCNADEDEDWKTIENEDDDNSEDENQNEDGNEDSELDQDSIEDKSDGEDNDLDDSDDNAHVFDGDEDINGDADETNDDDNKDEEENANVDINIPVNINSYLQFFIPERDAELIKPDPYIWNNCDQLDNRVLQKLSDGIDTSVIIDPNVCYWIGYKEDTQFHPKPFCKLCKPLYDRKILMDTKSSPLLSTFLTEGHWFKGRNKKHLNRRMITGHLNSKLHHIAVQYFENLDKRLPEAAFNKAMMTPQGKYYEFFSPTVNLIMATYRAVQLNLPFFKFHLFTETLVYAGLNTGFLHNNADGAKKSLMVVSNSMHQELLFHLLTVRPFINIILDDSTDVSSNTNSEILFQTFDNNGNVKTFHYNLLHLKLGGKGVQIFGVFWNQVVKDKIENLIKTKVIGFTTDGAQTLQSVFYSKLRAKADEHVLLVHCHSHKLELVIKNSIRKMPYIADIDKHVNTIARFFNSKASKRKSILRRKAFKNRRTETTGFRNRRNRFELKRIHQIRWVSHHKSAYMTILDHYKTIYDAVRTISTSTGFTDDQIRTALHIQSLLKDSTFLAHIAFLSDICSLFSKYSLVLQTKNSNLIGKNAIRHTLINSIASYNTEGGEVIRKLLRDAHLYSPNDDENSDEEVSFQDTLKVFESSYVVYKKVPLSLSSKPATSPTLSKAMPDYISRILKQFAKYFPQSLETNGFDVFDPLKLKHLADEDMTGQAEIKSVNKAFKLYYDDDDLFAEWKTCVNTIVLDPGFETKKSWDPAKFWLHYINSDAQYCSDNIFSLLKYVLITPGASSSAEQAFSLVTALKTKKRYSLDTSTIDAELRIKLNGEKDLSRVNFFAYARQFIKQHRRVDDDFRARPKSKDHSEYNSEGIRLRSIFEKPEL